MEGYILIVLQILITVLIIWRRKQDSKEPLGCLAAGFIFMIVFALTTVLFSLGHLIINEGLFANIFAESRGSLAAASPVEWLMSGFICLIMILDVYKRQSLRFSVDMINASLYPVRTPR